MSARQENDLQSSRFIKEGSADIELQRQRERQESAKLDTDFRTKERLTLQEQLRLNAITKQEEFSSLVKDRNSFNRLSKEDVNFYESLRRRAQLENQNLEEFLERNTREYDKRKAQALAHECGRSGSVPSRVQVPAKITKRSTPSKNGIKGVVKKKKPKSSQEVTKKRELAKTSVSEHSS
ncbi:LAQU0S05e02850g1_1 [Lachancea quebecensis]|uniref:LAQU0S05e02850g1_1 n=1 Tax=Lachancea quebecensis TaxID=1654605 RepID=A0A0P1KQP3_9SACH|nr:LAQU0S05e02850g1_1 [Lachancea quebecensis]